MNTRKIDPLLIAGLLLFFFTHIFAHRFGAMSVLWEFLTGVACALEILGVIRTMRSEGKQTKFKQWKGSLFKKV